MRLGHAGVFMNMTHPKRKGFDPPLHDTGREAFIRFVKGIFIGIGAILPGLSGGVLSVIFGLYDPLMRLLSHPFYKLRRNFRFFLPLVLGGGSGVVLFAFLVSAALESYGSLFTCLFIGLVAGTLPSLYRQAGKQGRSRSDVSVLLISALFIFALMAAGEQSIVTVQTGLFVWFCCGFLVGMGMIVPGLSPSNFLIYFNLYKPMSDAIKDFDMSAVIPLALGGAVSILTLSRLITRLLDKHYSKVYHLILGLVIGSSLAVFPAIVIPGLSDYSLRQMGLELPLAAGLSALLFLLGAGASMWFSRLEEKTEQDFT